MRARSWSYSASVITDWGAAYAMEVPSSLTVMVTVRVGQLRAVSTPTCSQLGRPLYAVEPPAADAVPDVVPHLEGRDRVGARVELTRLDQGGHRQRVPPSGRGILQPLYKSQRDRKSTRLNSSH